MMQHLNKRPLGALSAGSTIGIIGGGQLGRMLAMAAARLGFKTIVLDPGKDCPAAQTCNEHIVAGYDDRKALEKLSSHCDVITFEFENIPADSIKFLEENNYLYPSSKALENSQDRLIEKQFINALGIETAPYFDIASIADLSEANSQLNTPAILKTRRLGYDGKGQVRLSEKPEIDELEGAWASLKGVPCILEGFVDFQCEISVIIARGQSGESAVYDPAENVHLNGILHTSSLPARVSAQTGRRAAEIAVAIADSLDYVGVMGVEFFVKPDETPVVNEIAPRVHNSGHWTEAACLVSQFEQHIRAVTGCPLGNIARHSDCIMQNLIGDDIEQLPELVSKPDILLHLYGKSESRPGRKMGHFTRLL